MNDKTNGNVIKDTCENVIIVHETHSSSGSSTATESFINNKLNADNEPHLAAIEMLDTVLEEAEEDEDYSSSDEPLEIGINSRRTSSQSIKRNGDAMNVPVILLTRADCEDTSSVMTETKNLDIIDPEVVRREILLEIDEILDEAQARIVKMGQLNVNFNEAEGEVSINSGSEDDENVFRNQKFLTRLSDLISKSNQQTSQNQLNAQTKAAAAVDVDGTKAQLKPSKSVPNLNSIFAPLERDTKSFNDDTSVNYILGGDEEEDEGGSSRSAIIPPAPVFSAELFQKVASLRRKNNQQEAAEEDEDSILKVTGEKSHFMDAAAADDDDGESQDGDEPVNKNSIRDKLEKLLSAPPTRLSAIPPLPQPRTSILKLDSNEIEVEEDSSPRTASDITPAPVSATMKKQRELFDKVLRKLKHNDDTDDPDPISSREG